MRGVIHLNLDSLDKSLSESPLTMINTSGLLLLIGCSCLVGYLLLRFSKNRYDGSKLVKDYLIFFLPYILIGYLLSIPFLLVVGAYLLGGVFTYFKSNQMFYE